MAQNTLINIKGIDTIKISLGNKVNARNNRTLLNIRLPLANINFKNSNNRCFTTLNTILQN